MRILTWPIYCLVSVFEEVARQAEEALYDEAALHQELTTLNARFEAGDVSAEEFDRQEGELAARLALAEDFHRAKRRAVH